MKVPLRVRELSNGQLLLHVRACHDVRRVRLDLHDRNLLSDRNDSDETAERRTLCNLTRT